MQPLLLNPARTIITDIQTTKVKWLEHIKINHKAARVTVEHRMDSIKLTAAKNIKMLKVQFRKVLK
jgi:hypothetical protein